MGWQLHMSCDFCGEEDAGFYGSAEFSREQARRNGWLIRRKEGGFWNDELVCGDCREVGMHLTGTPVFEGGDGADARAFESVHPDFEWDGKTPIGVAMSEYLQNKSADVADIA